MKASLSHAPTAWFTGLSGAGKTTVSQAVVRLLEERGLRVAVLDAGDVRQQLFPDLGFTREDRDENVRRLGYLAGLLAGHGVIALVAAMSPERAARDAVRSQLPGFLEVFVDAPLAVCEERDPVGLYRRYHSGEIRHLSGLDDPYEPPLHPEVHCRTADLSVEACAAQVVEAIVKRLQS